MIVFENVSFGYNKERKILKDISFSIPDDSSVGLIGANGAGKSTLIRTLLGFNSFEGRITVNGYEVIRKNLPEIRRIMGYVMQNSDNQMFMPTVYEDMAFAPRNYGISPETIEQRAHSILSSLDILHLKNAYNHKLSGGEKKMASIATILMMEPSVLVMDEPTSMLDPYNRRKVQDAINRLPQTKLIASHDLDFIYDTCDQVLLIYDGSIISYDSTEATLRNRDLLESCHLELPYRFRQYQP